MRGLSVAGLKAEPGRIVHGRISAGSTMSRLPVELPISLICGSLEGPTLAVTAAVHGNELIGSFALTQLLRQIEPTKLRGNLVAVPVANTSAFEYGTRQTHWDGKILNRVGLGSPTGSHTDRLAHLLYSEVLSGVDAWIDIHSGTPENYMYYTIAPDLDRSTRTGRLSLDMALAFGLPDVAVSTPVWGTVVDNQMKIPRITPEIGGGPDFLRNGWSQVETCLQGITNVMKLLQMMDGPPTFAHDYARLWRLDTDVHCGAEGGFFVQKVGRGELIKQGECFGIVHHPYTGAVLEEIRAPRGGRVMHSGVVWPAVRPGQWLAVLGDVLEEVSLRP